MQGKLQAGDVFAKLYSRMIIGVNTLDLAQQKLAHIKDIQS